MSDIFYVRVNRCLSVGSWLTIYDKRSEEWIGHEATGKMHRLTHIHHSQGLAFCVSE